MKIINFLSVCIATFVVIFLITTVIAHSTGKFSISASAGISAGRGYNAGFDISVWRCEYVEREGPGEATTCRGFTFNETGFARTESGGGQVHN